MNNIARVRQGELRGTFDAGVYAFLGVPYAAAPVGDLRWRAPAPATPWNGVRDAQHFGPACIQTIGATFDVRVGEFSEDCLFLNVWTSTLSDARQPVMVWIHGGGNLGGAGSEDAFDGAHLARQGVTLVTINYRLGAFGFLAHPLLGANFGILDCVEALTWVHHNIRAFGGDPGNVTVFGESAGAVAVRSLMRCPRADGLYHRAVLQSAGFEQAAFAPARTPERAHATALRLFELMGANDPGELRALDSGALGHASHALCGLPPPPGRVHTPENLEWMPVVDGEVLVDGHDLRANLDVPVLLGYTRNEARYFLKPAGKYLPAQLAGMTAVLAGEQRDAVARLLAECNGEGDPYDAIDALFTAALFTEPALATIRLLTSAGRRLYCYRFDRVAPGARLNGDLARHTAEIRYVFGNLIRDGHYDDTDHALSGLMRAAWTGFARNGQPEIAPGQPWPPFVGERGPMVVIEDAATVRPFVVDALTELLNRLRR